MKNLIFIIVSLLCLTACQWDLEEIELANTQVICVQNCVNGTCNSNNICECQSGWQGVNCDESIENPTTNLNFCNTANCNNGTCNEALNRCECEDGWGGILCDLEVETFENTYTFGVLILEREGGITLNGLAGKSVVIDIDGSYTVIGKTTAYGCAVPYTTLFKIDENGKYLWADIMDGGEGKSIIQANDNYFILTSSSIIGSGNGTSFEISYPGKTLNGFAINKDQKVILFGYDRINAWFAKINEDGGIIWEKKYNCSIEDETTSTANSLFVTDTGYIIGGSVESGDIDYCLTKTDFDGNLLWSKSYGGNGIDNLSSIIQTNDNNYLLGGSSTSNDENVANNYGGQDIWIVKTNTEGEILWEKNYGGSSNDELKSILKLNDGNFILAGNTFSSDFDVSNHNGSSDFWLVKISPNGDILWEKAYGSEDNETLEDIKQTPDNGFIMVGSINDCELIYYIKTDANGEV